jgi:hypothetical protein
MFLNAFFILFLTGFAREFQGFATGFATFGQQMKVDNTGIATRHCTRQSSTGPRLSRLVGT